jgi:UDP-3-O-[3-hydroxymyristoyl] glucosamine N-acyltransferase
VRLTLSELAKLVDGDIIRGPSDRGFTGMMALDEAGPQDISFLGNEKYHTQFLTTQAGAVVVQRGETGGPEDVALVAVDNPTHAIGAVVKRFAAAAVPFIPGVHPHATVDPRAEFDPEKVSIGPGAVISAGVKIGDGTIIGPNSVLGDLVTVGRDCRIFANVTVRERCILGDRVALQPGAVIGADGFGYQFINGRHEKVDQVGIVVLGDDVEIGANTTVDRARFGKTSVGKGTKIDNLVQIGHNTVIGEHCLIAALSGISGSTRIGNYVTIGGQVGTTGHVSIGDKSVLAARTGVTHNLEGGQVYMGKPPLPIKEQLKLDVYVRRLPKMAAQIKELRQKAGLDGKADKS